MSTSHARLATWYDLLAQQLDAGVPMAEALRETIGGGLPGHDLLHMAERIEQHVSLEAVIQQAPPWLPQHERPILLAAARTGRLPTTLRYLSARHAELAALRWRLLLACAYPVAVLHAALLIFPLMDMIDFKIGFLWNGMAYARSLALTVGLLWLLTATVWFLHQRQSVGLRQAAKRLPAVGAYLRFQACADLAYALGHLLEAGLDLEQSWREVSQQTVDPELKRDAVTVYGWVVAHQAPGASLAKLPSFPVEFVARYRTGESTGHLPENLLQVAATYQDKAKRALAMVMVIYPSLMFSLAAGYVVYQVLHFYSGYFKSILEMANP